MSPCESIRGDYDDLLELHRPVLKYDRNESYRADGAGIMADPFTHPNGTAAARILLKRRPEGVIASTHPSGGQAALSLKFLGADYQGGAPARSADYLDIDSLDYANEAILRHRHRDYGDRVYGRAVKDENGKVWLQYWFFYFYNSKKVITGEHEGDWEMIQLGLGDDRRPHEVTYAQHGNGEKKTWAKIKKEQRDNAPVVFVALESHAAYFNANPRHPYRGGFDRATGDAPPVRPALVAMNERWADWPGTWGASVGRVPSIGDSPTAPCTKRQWCDPRGFHADADESWLGRIFAPSIPPPAPVIRAVWEDDHIVVEVTLAEPKPPEPEPEGLLVTVKSVGDDDPPLTYKRVVEGRSETVVTGPLADGTYEINALSVAGDGRTAASNTERVSSGSVEASESPPAVA
jgi:hypothetical protein